jgi:serine/threonine protein kinase
VIAKGTRIGRYEVLSLLGAGGMGEVYRARDLQLGREVAIKIITPTTSADPTAVDRFEREARAAAALSHPSIIAVHDIGTHEGSPFLVTELLEGETLRARIARGALDVRAGLDIAIQLAHGLAAAHARGIVHRDFKPDNVFLTTAGTAKILDFGLAKLSRPGQPAEIEVTTEQLTQPGVVLGTVGYMSPEQVVSAAVDHRTDQFGLGVIVYEMFGG